MNSNIQKFKIDNAIATYIAGGVFTQIAEGLSTQYQTSTSKEDKYFKNKLDEAVKVVNKLVRPLVTFLGNSQKEIAAKEIEKLMNIVSDVASLDEKEFKRINNLLEKIKNERWEKSYGKSKAA